MDTIQLRWHHHSQRVRWITAVFLSAVALVLGAAYFLWTRSPRIVRGVLIEDVSVSGLTREQAEKNVTTRLAPLEPQLITVSFEDQSWATSSASLGLRRDITAAVDEAFQLGRSAPTVAEQSVERAQLLASPRHIAVPLLLDEDAVRSWVSAIAAEVDIPGRKPSVTVTNASYTLDAGEYGQELQSEALIQEILSHPQQADPFPAPVEPTIIPLSADGLIRAEQRLQLLRPAEITLAQADNEPTITLTATDFFPWILLPDGWNADAIDTYIHALAEKLNRAPVDAKFEREGDSLHLKEFQPQRAGRELLTDELHIALVQKLSALEREEEGADEAISIPFRTLEPQVTLESLNTLGIRERLGSGNSTFFHSIPNRIFNVDLTTHRLHATLVPPGEEFSFNQAVGEVSRRTGYKPAYVISGGRTVLGDGGGVCQVSTTTFRAALDAGLPITKWKAHSYRVGYYEQNQDPGFDATVYAPSVDLRFLNDTDHYIAVATYIDTDAMFLAIELWGTSDGRRSIISDYSLVQTGTPAPAYIPDPSLPKGVVRQVDWAAPGATAKFQYAVVNKNGETQFEKEFVSRFQPWRAVFLVGTQ